jgi:crossover junction endodeoxyribonuclease RuvC
MTRIIGIDPGLAATGVGVVEGAGLSIAAFSYGSINTPGDTALPVRLDRIFSRMLRVLDEEKPDLMVVEDVFSLPQYPKSGITLGQVTGVVLLAGCRMKVPVVEIPVREAKQALTGNGNADKAQLERAVRQHLQAVAPIRPYHASDALGLALIGLFRCSDPRRPQHQRKAPTTRHR